MESYHKELCAMLSANLTANKRYLLLFGALEQKRSKSPFKWRSRSMERQDPFEMPAAGKITQKQQGLGLRAIAT